ncbi:MAG: hypothetical protein ACYC1U_11350 [Candidatus Aquicultorales bacterium]
MNSLDWSRYPELLKVSQYCRIFGVSKSTVYEEIKDKKNPLKAVYTRYGWRIPKARAKELWNETFGINREAKLASGS